MIDAIIAILFLPFFFGVCCCWLWFIGVLFGIVVNSIERLRGKEFLSIWKILKPINLFENTQKNSKQRPDKENHGITICLLSVFYFSVVYVTLSEFTQTGVQIIWDWKHIRCVGYLLISLYNWFGSLYIFGKKHRKATT